MDSAKGTLIRLLRWSEKYTKTDMVYLTKGSFWLFTSQITQGVLGLLLAIGYAHLLSKETYGTYRFVLSVAAIFSLANLSGLNVALTRAIAQGQMRTFLPIFLSRVRWGLLGSAAALLTAAYYLATGNQVIAAGIAIVAFFVPINDPMNVYEAYWSGLKNFRYIALADIIVRFGVVCCMIASLFYIKSIPALVFIYFGSYTLLQFAFFLHTRHDAQSRAKRAQTSSNATHALSFGKHMSIMYIISSLADQIDNILVFHYSGAATLAAYAFASIFIDQTRSGIKNVSTLAFPKFVTRNKSELMGGMRHRILFIGGFAMCIAGIYILIAPPLFHLLFSAYGESIPLTQLLALTLIDAVTLLPISALKAHGMVRSLYKFQITTALVQIASIWTGAALFGVYGLIYGHIFARVVEIAYVALLTSNRTIKS